MAANANRATQDAPPYRAGYFQVYAGAGAPTRDEWPDGRAGVDLAHLGPGRRVVQQGGGRARACALMTSQATSRRRRVTSTISVTRIEQRSKTATARKEPTPPTGWTTHWPRGHP